MKKLLLSISLLFSAFLISGCTFKTTYNGAFIDGKLNSSGSKNENEAVLCMPKQEETRQTTQHFSKFAGSANSIVSDIGDITKEIGIEFLSSKFKKVSFSNQCENGDFIVHPAISEYEFWLDMGLLSSTPTVELKMNFEAFDKNKNIHKKTINKLLVGNPVMEVGAGAREVSKLFHEAVLDSYKGLWRDMEVSGKLAFLNSSNGGQKGYHVEKSIDKAGSNSDTKSIVDEFGEWLKAQNDLAPLITAVVPSKSNRKSWLLAISVENYDSTVPVIYSNISGEDFVQTVQKVIGVPTQNTIYLNGDKATTGSVKDAIAKISELAEKGDTIYFYYSGHGIPSPTDNESYILPKDKSVEYVSKESELKLSHIYKTLEDSKAGKVVAIVDACFSGMTDGKAIYTGTAAGLLKPKSYTPSQKMVIVTAGKDNQFSNSYDAKGHRLFSYFVIKALLDGRKNINDIYQDVRLKVKDESRKKGGSYEQEPQMFGNGKLGL